MSCFNKFFWEELRVMGFNKATSIIHRIKSKIKYKAWMNDKSYLMRLYKDRFGVYPNLEDPKTFNEKNNWRKLYDRKDLYTLMVDKYRLKEIIEKRVGVNHTFKLLGVWDSPDDIDFDKLPNQFVLKVNHAGGVIICRDKSILDKKSTISELRFFLGIDYFIRNREWPYKNVKRKIIAEEYMGENLVDYKNYCFYGKLAYTLVWKNHPRADGRKPEAHFCGAYDREWNKTDMRLDYPTDDIEIEKPKKHGELLRVAEAMSRSIPFVRVDCYIINDSVYVGEMTFFPWAGFQKFKDEKWNVYLGELEQLPKKVSD